MVTYTPRHEEINGSDLSGSSGDLNRQYTLSHDNAINAQMQIIKSENILQNGINYTLDTTTNIITFLTVVFNDESITIDYFTESEPEPTPEEDSYCTTLQLVRNSGIGVEIFSEELGTGDESNKSFDLKNGNVITNSYSLYMSDSDNNFNNLVEETHYVINKDRGTIQLTNTGVAFLGTKTLYIDYIYSPKHSDTTLQTYINLVSYEVDKLTNNYWGSAKDSVQYFDGYDDGYPRTDRPFGEDIDNHPELILKYKGVNSITSVEFLDYQGNVTATLDSNESRLMTDDDYQESRLIILRPLINGLANIKVTFNSGYDTVPYLVQELASYVAGKMALVNISGGSYKDISTYSIGSKNFSIGQIYVNIESSIKRMQNRIDEILYLLGGNLGCA